MRHHATDMSEEIFSLREQLSLVTAAAEAADRELAERELTRNIDEQVIVDRDRAFAIVIQHGWQVRPPIVKRPSPSVNATNI